MPNSSPALFDCNGAAKQEADSYLFYENSIHDDFPDSLLWWFVYQVLEHEAGKITVQTLEEKFQKTDLREQSKWHHLCQVILSYRQLSASPEGITSKFCQCEAQQLWALVRTLQYFRGSKMLTSFICFSKIHNDTCLHTLVSFIACLFLNILLFYNTGSNWASLLWTTVAHYHLNC